MNHSLTEVKPGDAEICWRKWLGPGYTVQRPRWFINFVIGLEWVNDRVAIITWLHYSYDSRFSITRMFVSMNDSERCETPDIVLVRLGKRSAHED